MVPRALRVLAFIVPVQSQGHVLGVPPSAWESYWEGGSSFTCRDGAFSIPIERLNGAPCLAVPFRNGLASLLGHVKAST